MKLKRLKLIIITMGLFSIFACGQTSSLTQTEKDLSREINFEPEILIAVKKLTNNEFKQLPAIEEETGDILYCIYLMINILVVYIQK